LFCLQFYGAAKGVKTNQKECIELSRRVQQVERTIQGATPSDDGIKSSMPEVTRVLRESTDKVLTLQGRGFFSGLIKQQADARTLKSLGEQLTAAVTDKTAADTSEVLERLRSLQSSLTADMDTAAAQDSAAAEQAARASR